MFMRRFWVFPLNKPALYPFVLLFAIYAAAVVAEAWITGVGRWMGSEALFKGYPRFPDPMEGLLLVLCSDGYRGGGKGVEKRSRSSSRCLGRCASPLAIADELRRRPSPSGSGERQPVFEAPPRHSLVEWWPRALTAHRRRFLSFLPAGSQIGRQLCIFYSESTNSVAGFYWRRRRRGGDPSIPSGVVPGDGRIVSGKKMYFGPNCDFGSRPRVLSARIRDLLVIFLFVESCFELCTVSEFY